MQGKSPLTKAQILERRDQLHAEMEALRADPNAPRYAFWLSFADEEFKGAIIVPSAVNFLDAVDQTHRAGINPGGEVMSLRITPEVARNLDGVPMMKLLSAEELKSLALIGES